MKKIYLNELSRRLSINESALRYYDSKNLFPKMKRDENNYRFVYEEDILYINTIICLKKTGMSLENISHYLELIEKGLESVEERQDIIINQEKIVLEKIKDLENQLEFIQQKKIYYKEMLMKK
ncbi:MerR family transcriptional regulator [Spiroplasma diminutum]|uniref:MerR family transcriptional regulator n=1 Tax=Spiroplasma diminutum CUAS-1 TaxID=1276221 RepID=S5LVC6_9MOLU|nr:MerR family transcriptional regulator [Spiroplasma diminutum]AGR41744.1 MerR family transcriptional regulator [Spiroplasma diminutum CUAS-1]